MVWDLSLFQHRLGCWLVSRMKQPGLRHMSRSVV